MNAKHTPGPWELIDKGDGLFPSVLIGQRGIPYADGSGTYDRCGQITINGAAPGGPHELHVANARLIAAAPDMAAVLRQLVEEAWKSCASADLEDVLIAAHAALAKAGVQ